MTAIALDERPTLIVGLGNPILGDDGVGWAVIEEVERRLRSAETPPAAVVDRLSVGGLALMERLVGFDRVVLVDSMVTGDHLPGRVRVDPLDALRDRPAGHLDSGHDAPLTAALDAAAALGASLPSEVLVVSVEVEPCDTFADELTPAVAGAVPLAADAALEVLTDTLALAESWR